MICLSHLKTRTSLRSGLVWIESSVPVAKGDARASALGKSWFHVDATYIATDRVLHMRRECVYTGLFVPCRCDCFQFSLIVPIPGMI